MDTSARVDVLTLEQARWLVGDGLDMVADVAQRLLLGDPALAVGQHLRDRGLPPELARVAMDAGTARRLAVDEGREGADELLLTRPALEQASHPAVAAHRAGRFAEAEQVVDLGCGIGGDAMAIAAAGPSVLGVDRDEARLLLCQHNARVLGRAVTVQRGDALDPPGPRDVPAHADPGRRAGGRRARTLAEYEPPVGDLATSLQARPGSAIVLSPAVDLQDPDLPEGEVEFVQVGTRLVEAVLWLGALGRPDTLATATVLDTGGRPQSRHRTGPTPPLVVGEVGAYLVEPAPALVRARLHHDLALALGGRRISERRALLTCEHPPELGVWGIAWQVEAVLPGRPREVGRWLRTAEPLPLSISLHGDRRPVEPWWHAAKGQPRGPVGRRLLVIETEQGALAVLGRPTSPGIA